MPEFFIFVSGIASRQSIDLPFASSISGKGFEVRIIVRNDNVGQALKVLKRKLQQEGVIREMRRKEAYEKPSDKRRREKNQALRRKQRELRKLRAAELGHRG